MEKTKENKDVTIKQILVLSIVSYTIIKTVQLRRVPEIRNFFILPNSELPIRVLKNIRG